MTGENQNQIYTQTDAKDVLTAFITATNDVKENRRFEFEKYQKFVLEGEQWLADEKPEGEKPCLTFNHSENHIMTYLSKLFPRNSQTGTLAVGVKVRGEKKEEKEKAILDAYKRNKFASIILEQGQNYLVGGAGCFYYPKDPITKKAKIISINPTTVYLGWMGQDLVQVAFEDEIAMEDVETVKQNWLMEAFRNLFKDETQAQIKFKKTKRITYWDKSAQIVNVGENYQVAKNEDRLIPFSWIPNMPKAHSHEGVSEAKKLYNLDKEYNKRSSDFAQRVRANTKSVLAAFTDKDISKLDGEELEGVLQFNPADKAEFLHVMENKELLDYLDILATQMGEKMAINDAVKGDIKSNVSSLSMIYYFSPLMDRIGLKRIFWDEAFRELNSAILTYEFGTGDYDTDPVYEPVLLTDQATKINNTVLMLENKLITHEDAIDELRGSENAKEKIDGIIKDMELFGDNGKKPNKTETVEIV